MTSQPSMPVLTAWQIGALRRYASDFDKAQRQHAGRIIAAQALAAVKRALSPPQYAIVDFIAGRGLTVADLANRTGRRAADLATLLSQAATRLGHRYEAQGASQ